MLLKDLPITLKNYRDCAESAQRYYDRVRMIYEPLTLTIGIYAIEVTLKAIIEAYGGYLPEECKSHSCTSLATKANEIWKERGNLTKPLLHNDTISQISSLSHFCEDGRYPNRSNQFYRSTARAEDFTKLSAAYNNVLHAQKVVKKIIEAENEMQSERENFEERDEL